MADDSDREDLMDVPYFGGHDTPQAPAGRVRSTWKFPASESEPSPAPVQPVTSPRAWTPAPVSVSELVAMYRQRQGVDWLLVGELRVQVSQRLSDLMSGASWDKAEQQAQGWAVIRQLLDEDTAEALAAGNEVRSPSDQEALGQAVFDSVFRLGRLQPLVDDPEIENIMITGNDRVVVETSDGTMRHADPVADSDEELADFLAFLAARSDNPRPFTPANPSLHLMLEGGARLAAALDTARLSVTIRRHRVREVTLEDLVEWGSLSPVLADFLRAAIRARKSIVVSGAQGAGKTTLVRALCAELDPWEPIGTFETEYELFLHQLPNKHHTVRAWEVRSGSGERGADGRSAGARTIEEQIIDSFRYNLGRQILGEIRGPEVWQMVKLMESGSGSISTTHAANGQAAMRKLITCAMEAGPQVSQELAAAKLADTIDLIVHLACDVNQDAGGQHARKRRYVAEVLEVTPGERPRGFATNTIFAPAAGECAIASTRPDTLWDDLIAAGFNALGFERELADNRRPA
jgi:type IV secretory pathway ATPase VirB11/archaellum biosynthesis ATPase